jgi:aspartate/glutamate racemase
MKTIGLIGGMSWESTIPYYRQINENVKNQLGGMVLCTNTTHKVAPAIEAAVDPATAHC